MVDVVFGPGGWRTRNIVKPIIANQAMLAPKYAGFG
jgi:hypothetical protein